MGWPIAGRIRTRYQVGRRSTSLATTRLVYDAQDEDWYAAWVYPEELDRRRVRHLPSALADVKRLLASSRSS